MERDFFWTVAAAQISFVTNGAGRADSAIVHQGGRDVPIPRIDAAPEVHRSEHGA